METIGSRIERAAKQKGWTLAQFAAELGVSYETVRKWRLPGATAPNRKRVEKLCALLDVTPEWVMFGSSAAPLDERDRVHADPSADDAYSAMLTAFARQMAALPRSARVGIAAMLVDSDDPDKAAEVISQVRRLANTEPTPAVAASPPTPAEQPNQPMQFVRTSRPDDGRRQASRLIGNERNRPASKPRKSSSNK